MTDSPFTTTSSPHRTLQSTVKGFAFALFFAFQSLSVSYAQEATAQKENLLKTLVAGLVNRENTLENKTVSGTLMERRFLSPSHWNSIDKINEGWKSLRQKGLSSDRDMALIRFKLSKEQWFYEIQQLLWSGGSDWFALDFKKKPTDVRNLFKRAVSDGGFIHWYDERRGYPISFSEPLNEPNPGLGQLLFRQWLSAGYENMPASQKFVMDGTVRRLYDVRKDPVNGQDAFLVTFAANGKDFLGESRVWIAPDADYAIVKWENLNLYKKNPEHGTRYVVRWSNITKVNGIALPQRCIEEFYLYNTGLPASDTWRKWREIVFTNLKVEDKSAISIAELAQRAGSYAEAQALTLLHRNELNAEQAGLEEQKALLPWSEANKFKSTPLPQLDPQYLKPLTGKELQALATKYGYSLTQQ